MALIKRDTDDIVPVDEIYSRIAREQSDNTDTYRDILRACSKQIYDNASNFCTVFRIPTIYLKAPSYDRDTCTYILIKNLRQNGYYARLYPNNLLFISWHPDHIGYRDEQLSKIQKAHTIHNDSTLPTIDEREDGTNVLKI